MGQRERQMIGRVLRHIGYEIDVISRGCTRKRERRGSEREMTRCCRSWGRREIPIIGDCEHVGTFISHAHGGEFNTATHANAQQARLTALTTTVCSCCLIVRTVLTVPCCLIVLTVSSLSLCSLSYHVGSRCLTVLPCSADESRQTCAALY